MYEPATLRRVGYFSRAGVAVEYTRKNALNVWLPETVAHIHLTVRARAKNTTIKQKHDKTEMRNKMFKEKQTRIKRNVDKTKCV